MESRNAIYLAILFIASLQEFAIAAFGRNECHIRMSFYLRLDCCKDVMKPDRNFDLHFWECRRLPFKKPPSCDADMCIAMKRGFLNNDQTINNFALNKEVRQEFFDNPKLVKAIQEKCIDGDIRDYGLPNDCQVVKMKYCIELQKAMMCTSWDEERDYSENIYKTVEKCKKVL